MAELDAPLVRCVAAVAEPDAPLVRYVAAALPDECLAAVQVDDYSAPVVAEQAVRSLPVVRRDGWLAPVDSTADDLLPAGFAVAGLAQVDCSAEPTVAGRSLPEALLDDYLVQVHSRPDAHWRQADFQVDSLVDWRPARSPVYSQADSLLAGSQVD